MTVRQASSPSQPAAASANELPLYRLHLMRAGYFYMAVGLAIFKVPDLFSNGASRPLMEGVVTCFLTAMCILAFVGLRYPVRMLPLLLFESIWKLIWLASVALPAIMDDAVDPAMSELIFNCSMVVIILAVIPWRYVWQHYVTAKGDRWR
ncbi:hypothetical protein [Arthrobacter crystallopoietes]|uniref:hypothetical protein n=1 Tax=Crystallibacter crystallopoietes TaxID=37928 RepID=UPI0011112765|nr:hypothetical protein [Arthrobacter crystallopoietes]